MLSKLRLRYVELSLTLSRDALRSPRKCHASFVEYNREIACTNKLRFHPMYTLDTHK